MAKGERVFEASVQSMMSSPLVTATPDTPVWKAFEILLKNRIRRLPVLRGGRLVGIVTERDLFRWIMKTIYTPHIPEEIKRILG